MRRIRIAECTKPELDHYRDQCNFTQDEAAVFDMLARGWSQKQIYARLPYSDSTVGRIARRIREKMGRIAMTKT